MLYQDNLGLDSSRQNVDDETDFLFQKDSSFDALPPLFQFPRARRTPYGGFDFGNPYMFPNPPGYQDQHDIDSTAENFRSTEYVDGVEIGYGYEMNLDDYLFYRKNQIESNIWDSLTYDYDLKKALSGGDLAKLIGTSTGLTIPLPPNPLMGIFGKPEISINVNGEVNLRLGWRWDFQNLGTVSAFGQTQSTPMFDQDIRVNVSGRIGDKMKLSTDWNTRTTFDQDNQFKIGYEGYDDDIIKKIEVGNVSLPLNSELIQGGQALFGIRTDFQFGPLYLKTLFSQKRGQKKFVDVRGGVSKTYFSIRAYDFAKNHFFVDTAYKKVYADFFKYSTPVIPPEYSYLRIKELYLWESTNDVRDVQSGTSIAYADLEPKKMRQNETYDPSMKTNPIQTGEIERGNFMRMDSNRFTWDANLGTVHIKNLKQDRYYAVSYRVEGVSDATELDDEYYGTLQPLNQRDTLILKLIYRPNMQPGFKTIWDRQMKNIYPINATNVSVSETRVGLWYIRETNDSVDVLQGAPDKLVTIMGVDQVNNATGQTPPDGLFDLRPPFFDSRTGEITFPSPEPFGDGLRAYFEKVGNPGLAEKYVFSDVYEKTYDEARLNTERDRFVISGEVSGRQTNRISLGAFNLTPGSVRVTLDGVPLREYEDYVVDYFAGTLTLRNQRASLPNANLKIEYEQQDIFNISTRTMAGIRADYDLYRSRRLTSILGFTLMLYDQSALIDRVRLGDEPVSNTMMGFDAALEWDAPWITKALDALPFYDTKAPSSLSLRGEMALILPKPNKRESTVASDYGAPVVYIDDFEGAQRQIPLGMNPSQWQHSSQPVDSSIGPGAVEVADFRGKAFWYQYFIPRIPITDVYPEQETYQGNRTLNPLYIDFNPYERGIYNKNVNLPDSSNPEFNAQDFSLYMTGNKSKMWGGMQRLFSSFNTNFETDNIEYIEVMMHISQFEPGKTKMFIEMGQISEDIIPDQSTSTEDGFTTDNPLPNNIIDEGEDVGIDQINNTVEKEEYLAPLNLEDDPAKDDYTFSFGKDDYERVADDFKNYNNFEGNSKISELGQFPDTEVLNRNNGQEIIRANDYFQYEIDLNPDPENNSQIVGGNPNRGWFLYRIPLRKPSKRIGNPLFSNIQYARIWWKGGRFKGEIADWNLIGSQWRRINNFQSNVSPQDSVLQIAFVNLFENSGAPEYYTMPPGVTAPRQLNNPDPNLDIKLNEQSLSVCVRNLRYGEERMAVRIFQPQDIFYYKKLKFFIHGDGSMPDQMAQSGIPKAYAFLRFGMDSNNYYEYRRPLLRGWQDIEVVLSELTAIKQVRDSSGIFDRQVFPVPNDPIGTFAIKGYPILTRVQFFGVGIANPDERFPNDLTTCMWIDELRLIDPESGTDWAGVASANVKLADLGSVNASFNNSQPNFHRIEDRFGNRVAQTNWNFNVQGNLEKLTPKSFSSMKIPISYSHSEYMENPEFVANSDINLEQASDAAGFHTYNKAIEEGKSPDEALRLSNQTANDVLLRSRTMRVQDSWALQGVKLGIPIDHWLVGQTFNKLTLGYAYAQEYERTPVYQQRFNWNWQLNAQYSNNLPNVLEFSPLGWLEGVPLIGIYSGLKINPLPTNFSLGLNMTRRRQTEKSRFLDFPSPVIRDFSAMRTAQFSWKISSGGLINPLIDYSINTNSTLVNYETDEFGRQRTGRELADIIFFNDGSIINFGQNNMHNQNVVINFKPVLPNFFNLSNYLDITGSYTANYMWQDPLQEIEAIKDIARNASYNGALRFNMSLRLKSLANNWFGIADVSKTFSRRKVPTKPEDSTSVDTPEPSRGFFTELGLVFKTIFLDFDKLDFTFTQGNSSTNPGVYGSTGLSNFWGRGLAFRESTLDFGPSFAYQMGLITNPHGGFNFISSDKFPYFGFDTYTGLRPANGVMQDNFNQKSTLELKTKRPLWEGAQLDLNWTTDLGYSRNQTVVTGADGVPRFTNIIAMESFSRNFLTFPSFFGLDVFNNNIEHVVELYKERETQIMTVPMDTVQRALSLQNALAESFYQGLEAFTFFGGSAGKFLPAVNWEIRWEGLENFYLWEDWVQKMSFQHKYQSKYQENVQITDNGREIQNQIVDMQFQPLVGINVAFDEKAIGGNLVGSFNWNQTRGFNLNSSARSTISAQSSTKFTAQATYTMEGFEMSLLGINLQNDLEMIMTTSVQINDRSTFDITDENSYKDNDEGRTLDGNTQITLEPRIRYTVSNRLKASFFVRYEGTFTRGAAQPGYHTTQVGFDLNLSISGGR